MSTRASAIALCLCSAVAAGCPADDGGAPDAGPAPPDSGVIEQGFLAALDELADFEALDGADGTVKYLLPVEGAAPQPPIFDTCAFQDTAAFAFHIPFLRSLPGGEELSFDQYVAFVLRRATRVWWGGDVLYHPDDAHPLTGAAGVLLYTLYTEDTPGNRLVIDDVRAVHAELLVCAPAFAAMLAFVPSSAEQRATAALIQGTLADEGIAVVLQ